MPEGQVLEFSGVTKRFGAVAAVSGFSARVEPGSVTGFLGPNGAGKTTSLRILLGLVRADEGTATIGGRPYAKLARPLSTVGAVLEASSFHPGRTAANHLKVYALAAGLPPSRVDETLGMVGLSDVAGRKVGGFSLGMRQRLGLAYALLGDPGVLVLDEPANGLDPEGIKWMRGMLRELARQGRTVLVSSHLLAEVQQTVDSLLIIAQGRLVFEGRLDELTDPSEYAAVADSPDRGALAAALDAAGIRYEVLRSGLTVRGIDTAVIGQAAASAGVALSGLQRRGPALEEVFLELVSGMRVHTPRQGMLEAAALAEAEAEAHATEPEPESGTPEAEPAAAEPDADAQPEPAAAEPEAEPEPPAAEAADPASAPEAAIASATGAAGAFAVAGVAEVADARSSEQTGTEEPPADAGDHAPQGTAADDPPPGGETPAHRGFTVASTGVIDIIDPEELGDESAGHEEGDPR